MDARRDMELGQAAFDTVSSLIAPVRIFQPLEISQILRPTCSALVANQMLDREHRHGLARKSGRDASRPCFVEIDAVNAGENVDTQGSDADLKYHTALAQLSYPRIVERCAPNAVSACNTQLFLRSTGQRVLPRHLNPYVNFHRPCLFAETITDAKGRSRKRYPYKLMMTPYEKLKSLHEAQQFLKPGITIPALQAALPEMGLVELQFRCRASGTRSSAPAALPSSQALPRGSARRRKDSACGSET